MSKEKNQTDRSLPWRLFRSAVAIYLAVCLLVFLLQRRFQYFPKATEVPLPSGERFRGLEEAAMTTDDGLRILGWYWPGTRPVTLVIFHGNAGHRGHRIDWVERLHKLEVGVFILDYRGYGGSQGSPTEEGLYRDAEAALRWLRERDAGRLVYVGESLGSAVAVEMAARESPAALIVQSGFSSAVDVAQKVYFFLPVRLLMWDRFESTKRLSKVTCSSLFIHGGQDEIIPVDLGRALFEAAAEPKEWYIVPGAGHNDLIFTGGTAYYRRIDEFLRRHVGP